MESDTDQTYHYPMFTFWHHKAVHSCCTIMCRGLWFSGLGNSLSNPLQTKCTDLYINGTSVKCLWCLLQYEYLYLSPSTKGFQLYVATYVYPGVQVMTIFFQNCPREYSKCTLMCLTAGKWDKNCKNIYYVLCYKSLCILYTDKYSKYHSYVCSTFWAL